MQEDRKAILEGLQVWLSAWSPGEDSWTGDGLETVFADGPGAIHVVDDFEGGAIVLTSYKEYVTKWQPVMEAFGYWSIALEEDPVVRISHDLAVVTFTFRATARLPDGSSITPAPGQHGTHVWERQGGNWRIVHEHLTNV